MWNNYIALFVAQHIWENRSWDLVDHVKFEFVSCVRVCAGWAKKATKKSPMTNFVLVENGLMENQNFLIEANTHMHKCSAYNSIKLIYFDDFQLITIELNIIVKVHFSALLVFASDGSNFICNVFDSPINSICVQIQHAILI